MTDCVAVVVGLCAHGLAICRALHGAGIDVLALEKNPVLPGVTTNSAEVRFVDDINGHGLIDSLVDLAATISTRGVPVLFLTNDNMVDTVGRHYKEIKELYRVSWGHAEGKLRPLLLKKNVEDRCAKTGLAYPKSTVVKSKPDILASQRGLRFPIIFKPDTPISSYKTFVANNKRDLKVAALIVSRSLPSVAQEFIAGDDSSIFFAALYLDRGRVLARFEGRKLRSRPMGHTTVAVSEVNDKVHDLACRFFDGLELSGPVSLEVKRDEDSVFWVIEPTVGRSDFWVGLCIADGVNLPLIEYNNQCEIAVEATAQRDRTVWTNGERDPLALVWLLVRYPKVLIGRSNSAVYFNGSDMTPFRRSALVWYRMLPGRVIRKLRKLARI